MTAEAERIGETDLLAYVDGHLDPARRRAVEVWLSRHPDDARRVAADLAINDGIRRLFACAFEEDVPAALRQRLEAPGPVVLAPLLRRVAAAVLLLAGGAAGGWWSAVSEPAAPSLAGLDRLAALPVRAAGATGGGAEDLAEAVRRAVRLPDLSTAGYRLVAQGLGGGSGRPVLQLTYEDGRGERLRLFIQLRETADRRLHARDSLIYWAEGPLVFALSADLPAEELRVLAELVHAAPPARSPRRPAPLVPVAGGSPR